MVTELHFNTLDSIYTSVSFSCCANLKKLRYLYHKLTEANLIQNCTALTNIGLHHGRLTTFPDIRYHNMLERIDLTYNKISLLTSDMLPKSGFLTYIRLEHNSFKTLPDISEMFTNSITANLKVHIFRCPLNPGIENKHALFQEKTLHDIFFHFTYQGWDDGQLAVYWL